MAASRKPGPIGTDGIVADINDGTLVRNLSPIPGSTGRQFHYGLKHHRIAPGRQHPAHKGLPTLRQGSHDPLVRWAQLLLNQHGANPPLQPNSIFDAETHAAVVSFQRSQKLAVDGVIGMDTWAKLVVTLLPEQGSARRTVLRSPAVSLQPVAYPPTGSGMEKVADWPLTGRFEQVLRRVPSYLSPELAMQFRAMLTPANIGIVVGTLAVWAVSQAFGVGEIVDVVLLGVGAAFVGMGIFQAAKDIGNCLMTTLHARDTEDLEKAAHSLAQAIVILGVIAFFTLLGRVAARFGGAGGPAEEGSAGAGTVEEPKAAAARAGAGTAETPPKPSATSDTGSLDEKAVDDGKPAVDKGAVEAWKDSLETRSPAGQNMPDARNFQMRNCGDTEYLVKGGGEQVWADGINTDQGLIQDAKYVGDPDRSPFVSDSQIPERVRNMINRDVEDEFQRYAAVVSDPNTPVNGLQVITNDSRAVPYFEGLMQKYGIPGTVDVKP